SVKVAGAFLALLPREGAPETTEGKQGYIHPISIKGNTSETEVTLLIRDFDVEGLAPRADAIRGYAEQACAQWPGSSFKVEIKQYYRNMKYDLAKEPRAMDYAFEAVRRTGLDPVRGSIRGGTDGSVLSARGLPTPNVFTGEQDFHGYGEWICVKDMQLASDTVLHLIAVWAEKEA
ncbi:MAG TPA: peptidase T, partial [Candidatus Krumholzibacteria bacterium]|nr:peptidase T [Candidatus Krumholzibacteria bacterium]